MDQLKFVLDKILKASPQYESKQKQFEIFEKWEAVVGPKIARHATPKFLADDGVLSIATDSSVWSQHLKMMERQILAKIQDALKDKNRVKALRFYVTSPSKREA